MKKILLLIFGCLLLIQCSNENQKKNDWVKGNLKGKVKSKKEIIYKAVEKFGEIQKGNRLNSSLIKYNSKFWGGISYRGTFFGKNAVNGFAFFAGVKIKEIHIGYAYDLSIKSIKKGGHEIVAGYCFNFKIEKSPEGYKNVRFL